MEDEDDSSNYGIHLALYANQFRSVARIISWEYQVYFLSRIHTQSFLLFEITSQKGSLYCNVFEILFCLAKTLQSGSSSGAAENERHLPAKLILRQMNALHNLSLSGGQAIWGL